MAPCFLFAVVCAACKMLQGFWGALLYCCCCKDLLLECCLVCIILCAFILGFYIIICNCPYLPLAILHKSTQEAQVIVLLLAWLSKRIWECAPFPDPGFPPLLPHPSVFQFSCPGLVLGLVSCCHDCAEWLTPIQHPNADWYIPGRPTLHGSLQHCNQQRPSVAREGSWLYVVRFKSADKPPPIAIYADDTCITVPSSVLSAESARKA